MKTIKKYKFQTNFSSGEIEAYSFGVAKKKLRSMYGIMWGWVEDEDGYRYSYRYSYRDKKAGKGCIALRGALRSL